MNRPSVPSSVSGAYGLAERKVSSVCRDVLGYEEINILDNFFELGADSIMLGLIFQGLDSLYPDLLQATDLFAYPTVKSLSEHIVEWRR